ncbi:tetratricopeptide repeat protein [soil metagenome]
MPDLPFRFGRTRLLAALLASMALAHVGAQAAAPAASPVQNSNLDAPLFYQLLIGEMELRSGEAGTAYQVMLDAARRAKDDQLFRRATDIALQARAGDQALAAVKAWRQTLPESLDAHRYEIQLLVALNRSGETAEPVGSLLKVASPADRPALIMTLPRFFARATDRAAAAAAIESAVQPYTNAPETRAFARATIGRAWLATGDTAKALDQAQRAHELDPASEAPAVLALELLPGVAPAEAVVLGHLKAKPDSNGVWLLYVRTLAASQRYADANAQLQTLTTAQPNLAPPWLTLGALQLELKHPAEATVALQKYVALVQAESSTATAKATPAAASDASADGDDDDAAPAGADAADAPAQALTQAWLLLSQAAEQQRDFPAAEAWLAKIDNPQRALDVQVRRASLLARQGKMAEARALIQKLPEKTPAEARGKLLAEAQLLRDAKQWQDAYTVLGQANEKFADDVDLLYEQSMMAEKLNKLDDMERLLRRVIALKPDHQHAYNALGYSLAERNMRLPEARTLIKKALDLSPGEPFITDSLGWVEYRLGNKDEALRLLRGAYQSRPDVEIAAHLGEVLWVSGQTDEAKRVWREARTRDSANDVLREKLARLRVDL